MTTDTSRIHKALTALGFDVAGIDHISMYPGKIYVEFVAEATWIELNPDTLEVINTKAESEFQDVYPLTHNITAEFVELSAHPRNCNCPHCNGEPEDWGE